MYFFVVQCFEKFILFFPLTSGLKLAFSMTTVLSVDLFRFKNTDAFFSCVNSQTHVERHKMSVQNTIILNAPQKNKQTRGKHKKYNLFRYLHHKEESILTKINSFSRLTLYLLIY